MWHVPSLVLVVLSVAKDLTERSDTGRVAGVRSFATLRTTGSIAQHKKVDVRYEIAKEFAPSVGVVISRWQALVGLKVWF